MSVLFASNVEDRRLEDDEDDEDIFSQFNITAPEKGPPQNAEPPAQITSISAITGCSLKTRSRHVGDQVFSDMDAQAPYGIPIFELLHRVEKKRKIPSHARASSSQLRPHKKARTQPGELLCEKYRPQQFFDLVGNDDANRKVLRWLSRWRAMVFGTEPELSDYTDIYGRPLKKLLLLNGPPGSGKTSAVHAIAKQAGYDVLEINASDERNAAVVNERIASAVQSHQAYSKRPICIIADEVEGASEHGFARSLVNILKDDELAVSRAGQQHQSSRKRKPKLLRRPIIAVCNDVWAPNLHALRHHAEIVHFQRHTPSRLLKRLEVICRDEGIDLTSRTLSGITEACDYDLRACLNAIQFGAHYSFDDDRENFELTDWSALAKMQFQAQKPASFQQLESCSDLDKLIASCFTAYTNCSYIDDMMSKPAALGDFLSLADSRSTTDEIKAMVAHSFGYFFRSPRLSASRAKVPLLGGRVFAKPPSNYEAIKQTRSLVDLAMRQSGQVIRRSSSRMTALTELLPFAIKLACPQTSATVKVDDKKRFVSLAASLKDLGLSFKAEPLENGTLAHKLDPPIEMAVIFEESSRELASSWKLMPRSQLLRGFHELDRLGNTPVVQPPSASMPELNAPDKSSTDPQARKYGFFGDQIEISATQAERHADLKARKVWVQFSEGFSNAVRKPILWDELFHI